jgi:predicted nucleotidyltransferase
MTRQRSVLYQHAYPALLYQIDQLRTLIQKHDDNVQFVVLFGSTARLTPRLHSDADLLILVHRRDDFYQRSGLSPQGVALLVAAENAAMEHGGWEWPFISMVEEVGELPPALLENIARDGVLLYQRQDVPLPAALSKLLPYEAWRKRVEAMLVLPSATTR